MPRHQLKREVWFGSSVAAPAEVVADLLPIGLHEAGLGFSARPSLERAAYIGELSSWRRVGRWTSGRASGEAHVEVISQVDGGSSELVVRVAPPAGIRGLLWTRARLEGVARRLSEVARRGFAPIEVRVPVERTASRRGASVSRRASAS